MPLQIWVTEELCTPQGYPHLLADATYCTGTPYNTPDSLHTAGTFMGGAEKAQMLQNNFLQEIHLPWLPGHAGQTNALVPVRKTAAQLEQSHKLPQNSQDTVRSHTGLLQGPQVCYTGCTGHSAICKTFLKLFSLSLFFLKQMLLTGGNKFHSDPLSTAFRLCFACYTCAYWCEPLYLYYFLLPYASDSWKIHFLGLASNPTPAYIYLQIQLFYASLNLCILL